MEEEVKSERRRARESWRGKKQAAQHSQRLLHRVVLLSARLLGSVTSCRPGWLLGSRGSPWLLPFIGCGANNDPSLSPLQPPTQRDVPTGKGLELTSGLHRQAPRSCRAHAPRTNENCCRGPSQVSFLFLSPLTSIAHYDRPLPQLQQLRETVRRLLPRACQRLQPTARGIGGPQDREAARLSYRWLCGTRVAVGGEFRACRILQ